MTCNAPESAIEVVELDDGWAWRCWERGWHGVGLYSETAARSEVTTHRTWLASALAA